MQPIKRLLAVLMLAQSNFQILHWKSIGKKFDKQHSIAAELYEKCFNDQDTIAEFSIMLGISPVNIVSAIETLREDDSHEYVIVDPEKDFEYDEFVKTVSTVLGDIKYAIFTTLSDEEIQNNIVNIGIKSTLESIVGEYDLQDRYLNTRRSDD